MPFDDPAPGVVPIEVTGLRMGRLFVKTWRKRRVPLGRTLPHWLWVWGEGFPPLIGVVRRRGILIAKAELKDGFSLWADRKQFAVRRPGYGLLPRQRRILIQADEADWTLQARPPGATCLFREDGSLVARYTYCRTSVDEDATAEEAVLSLALLACHAPLRVVSPLAAILTVNLPRFGGAQYMT